MMHSLRVAFLWVFRVATTLVVAAVLWGAVYLATRGFTQQWRDLVTREIRKHGIEISMRKLTLDPLNGLVARDVRVVDSQKSRRVVARIDRVAIEVNFSNIVNHKRFLDALELRQAALSLPVNAKDPNAEPLEITKLNARILFPPDQIYIQRLDADVFGIAVSANGRVVNSETLRSGKKKKKEEGTGPDWVKITRKIREDFEFAGKPPRIAVHLSGDISRPAELFADATINAHNFRFKGCEINALDLDVQLHEGRVELRALTAVDALGKLEATGNYLLATRAFEGSMRSTMDVRPLIAAFDRDKAAESLTVLAPPRLEFTTSGTAAPGQYRLFGTVDCGAFTIRGAKFDSAVAAVAWDGSQLMLQNVSIRNRQGELSARALNVPGDFRVILDSNINPRDLAPLLTGKVAEVAGDWEFLSAPKIHLRVAGPSPNLAECQATGEIALGKTRFRKVAMKSATTKVEIKDGACTYNDFKVERDEGTGTGSFAYDFKKKEVRINKVRMNLVPTDVAMWIDPRLAHDIAPYRFKAPPLVTVDGTVTLNGRTDTLLRVGIHSPKGMDYTFLKRNLSLPEVRADLVFTDRHMQIQNLDGNLFGGDIRGNADISLRPDDRSYSANIDVKDIDFPKLTKLYFDYDDSRGKMDGFFHWKGVGDDARSLDGDAKLEVRDGNVFAIPVFGPLSNMLNTVVQGSGYRIARQGTATATVKRGAIETNDFKVVGNGFEMLGHGKLFYLDDRMDFTIRVTPSGVTGTILTPVTRLLEYTAQSSLSKPVWKPKRLPSL